MALYAPLTILLLGIVLRGSAFAFRSHSGDSAMERTLWSRVFAIASLVSPVMLGICVGAIASGAVSGRDLNLTSELGARWLAPFPVALGFLTLALFAFLAAVYLTVETDDDGLQEGFRIRALASGAVVGMMAFVCLGLARSGAPLVYAALVGKPWSMAFHGVTGVAALGALIALWRRRFVLARALAALQVVLILCGWALAQFPYLLPPTLTFTEAAAPHSVLVLVTIALACGTVLLVPSLFLLFRVFKASRI